MRLRKFTWNACPRRGLAFVTGAGFGRRGDGVASENLYVQVEQERGRLRPAPWLSCSPGPGGSLLTRGWTGAQSRATSPVPSLPCLSRLGAEATLHGLTVERPTPGTLMGLAEPIWLAGSEKTGSRLPLDTAVTCPLRTHRLRDEVSLSELADAALSALPLARDSHPWPGTAGAACRGRGAQQKVISEGAASWSPLRITVLITACRASPSGNPDKSQCSAVLPLPPSDLEHAKG